MPRKKLFLLVGFIYTAFTFVNLVSQEIRLQKYQERLDVDMQQVLKEQKNLQSSILYYQTNMGVEEIARKHLGYYKHDEVPIRIVQPPVPSR